ncbi:MAG: hypothetical protein FJ202_06400 [Gemmatimonadetes bacterium]|nr:hypothetical protein [Gemmatimonadota bacterium]
MYEPRHHRPLGRSAFIRRLASHATAVGGIVLLSLLIGMAGYHYFEGVPWIDAFLDAAMLLGGEGPVRAPQSSAGKLFAGSYALYSGLVFLVALAVLIAPIVHRVLHKFHWDEK